MEQLGIERCEGIACGNLLIKGSVPADRLEYNSFRELLKYTIEKFSNEKWFKDIFREIIKEFSKESWFYDIFETIITDSFDEKWFKDLIKKMFEQLVTEQWFKDLICSLGCGGAQPVFDVNPKELIFDSEGGEKSFTVSTNSTVSWNVSC